MSWLILVALSFSAGNWIQDELVPKNSILLTISSPEPKQYELALDESAIDWNRSTGESARAVLPDGAVLVEKPGSPTVLSISRVTSADQLADVTQAFEAANPGATAHLVLYEAGRPRTEASRRLLTREVALLLDDDRDPGELVRSVVNGVPRPIPGVPRAFVIEADDPLAALGVADALRLLPGVRNAYPLLRRQLFPN